MHATGSHRCLSQGILLQNYCIARGTALLGGGGALTSGRRYPRPTVVIHSVRTVLGELGGHR